MDEENNKIKSKIMSFFMKILKYIKTNKIISIIVLAVVIILLFGLIIIFGNSNEKSALPGNLSNLGFSVRQGNNLYYCGYYDGSIDGVHKLKGKTNTKISED